MASHSITISGEEHQLRFTLRSLREIERVSGVKVTSPDMADWVGSIEGIGTLLWAGLLHEGQDRTLQEVEEMVDMDDTPALAQILVSAFAEDMPKQGSVPNLRAGSRLRKAPRSTGTSSGV